MTSLALLFDTGCFVLIWLVQLVIYPSFEFYSVDRLKTWHAKYTRKITIVVLPLMLGQLITSVFETTTLDMVSIFKFVLVLLTWLTTFTIFVPLHDKVEKIDDLQETLKKLVLKNWVRTALWSLILLISLVKSF